MISHLFIGLSDFDRAIAFYRPIAAALGLHERFCEADPGWAGWHQSGQVRPLFIVGRPWNGEPHVPGNGQMIAFMVERRAQVRALHALALSLGGTCEGAPGLRPQYHRHYYGAYFRDTEGNKLAVACHGAEAVAGD